MAHPRLALCLEQTLGHRAHGQNLEAAAGSRANTDVVRVEYPDRTRLRVPWALRGSWLARSQLRDRGRRDAILFHTQTISLFAAQASRGAPYVVSLDATPRQVDEMGQWYRHGAGPRPVEAAKARWYREVFAGASALVTWSQWAADSLVREYGCAGKRIEVAHPGASRAFFEIQRVSKSARPRILFVGGDFERKGGHDLLRAFEPLAGRAELVLVTEAQVPERPGVRVVHGVRPGTPEQFRAFAEADIFCLPTYGDCTSVAIGEALAAGLPVVTTSVGSNRETVPEAAGRIIAPGDAPALTAALDELASDASLRLRAGEAAREHARAHMDAAANARRVLALLEEVA
ncbi:MAG: glycosyltransferase family 4 protein [Hyphomicrobiales bacterium]